MYVVVSSSIRGIMTIPFQQIDPPLVQLTINWALLGGALLIAIPTVLSITPSPVVGSQEYDSKEKGNSSDKD